MAIEVGIIMGSDSDLPVMQEAAKMLDYFGIEYELTIVSAHRTPDRLFDYSKKAKDRQLKVLIAGAGGAAHLPGMVASITPVPVIGVPIKTQTLNGIDSLYSIVQMPPGIPVATMAINGAKNAGILAAQIIGSFNAEISSKIVRYKEELKEMVEEKATTLEKLGYEHYLNKGL
ncbi:MAG: 5-(carboxyamino)imidazole ribonucleotide mutase [Firmicutes bacterium HGW-Firmicutes-1]|jgi:5-(carboxyamino)imidazole ribonucleotide mutase|nr:MAG: 5-(carboxyamino)imidazole ribonucleotide mutase [Firmicutes bacterium HGW-Firmicutes-1]